MSVRKSLEHEPDPAGYEPMAHAVTRRLRDAIIGGEIRPGAPVRQETIAREMGTSRIPVREALRQLEAEGLITIRPHFGARVAVQDFEECMEVYKIREQLEPLAIAESMSLMTHAQIDEAATLARDIEAKTADAAAWLDLDRRFHLACYVAAPLPRLLRMIENYWNTTQQYRRIVLATFTEHDFHVFQGEHQLIVEALRERDEDAGKNLVRIHLERGRRRLAANRQLFQS